MIAITSSGNKLNSYMDLRVVSCPFFGILKENETEFIPNPFQYMEGDISRMLVQWLNEQNITLLITGDLSSMAKQYLKRAQIETLLIDNDKNTLQSVMCKIA